MEADLREAKATQNSRLLAGRDASGAGLDVQRIEQRLDNLIHNTMLSGSGGSGQMASLSLGAQMGGAVTAGTMENERLRSQVEAQKKQQQIETAMQGSNLREKGAEILGVSPDEFWEKLDSDKRRAIAKAQLGDPGDLQQRWEASGKSKPGALRQPPELPTTPRSAARTPRSQAADSPEEDFASPQAEPEPKRED